MNLYERLGGEAALETVVEHLYHRALADPELMAFFEGVDMAALRMHQKQFLMHVLGGPVAATRGLREAHARLKVEGRHFYAITDHLLEALAALGIDDELNGEVLSLIEPLSREIVTTQETGR